MILVLTYHKVRRAAEPEPGFYTIRAEQLERQLELLAHSGLLAASPEKLAAGEPPAQRSYLLTFDDGTADHYEVVLPLLARFRARAVFFVPSARIGRSGYLTTQQIAEMSRGGQTIGLHSHEHRRMDCLSEEAARQQMSRSRQIIGELTGQPPVFFAPVGGYVNRRLREIALASGVRIIRTMRWGYNSKLDLASLQCIPVNRHFTEAQFAQVLAFRRRSTMLYAAKEITKKVMPSRTYESLRRMVFGHSAHG